VTGSLTVDGSSYSTVLRPAVVSSWATIFSYLMANGAQTSPSSIAGGLRAYGSGALGDNTTNPGGTDLGAATSVTVGSYSAGSFQQSYTISWGLSPVTSSISNFNCYTALGLFKGSFSPAIPKTGSNVFAINFRVSWSRTSSTASVNPSIGNLLAESTRVIPTGTISLTSRVEFRTDGSIYKTITTQAGANVSSKIGEWYQPLSTGIGSSYQIKFTSISGSDGTLTGSSIGSFAPMSSTTFVQLNHSSAGIYFYERQLSYEIQASGGGPALATGTIDLLVSREF